MCAQAVSVSPSHAKCSLPRPYFAGSYVFNNFTLSKGFLVDKANKVGWRSTAREAVLV